MPVQVRNGQVGQIQAQQYPYNGVAAYAGGQGHAIGLLGKVRVHTQQPGQQVRAHNPMLSHGRRGTKPFPKKIVGMGLTQ